MQKYLMWLIALTTGFVIGLCMPRGSEIVVSTDEAGTEIEHRRSPHKIREYLVDANEDGVLESSGVVSKTSDEGAFFFPQPVNRAGRNSLWNAHQNHWFRFGTATSLNEPSR